MYTIKVMVKIASMTVVDDILKSQGIYLKLYLEPHFSTSNLNTC